MSTPIQVNGLCPLLQVYDMPTSLHFYRDKLGFSLVGSSGEGDDVDWIWLRLDSTEIMLNAAYEKQYRLSVKDESRQKAHTDTSIYFGCPGVNETYKMLLEKGVDVKPPIKTGYNFMALYVFDPDGYQLVFHWPVKKK
jgi:glyoxylase I family protein